MELEEYVLTGSRHTCPSECNQPKSVLLSLAKQEQCALSLKVPYLVRFFY